MSRPLAIAAAALTFSGGAAAYSGGWDWDEEIQFRIWRPAALSWAGQIHPQHPSPAFLQAFVAPPPREMWCVAHVPPDAEDCEEHKARLELWAEDYLGAFVPAEELGWPRECPSSCYPS